MCVEVVGVGCTVWQGGGGYGNGGVKGYAGWSVCVCLDSGEGGGLEIRPGHKHHTHLPSMTSFSRSSC